MFLTTDGKLGVGTTAPQYKLDVSGIAQANTLRLNGGTVSDTNVDTSNLTNTFIRFAEAGAASDWAYLRQIGGSDAFALALDFHDDTNSSFVIREVTSVSNPDTIQERFRVQGAQTSVTGNLSVTGDLIIDANTLKVDSNNNRVGINNASPAYELDISGTTNIATGSTYKIGGADIITTTKLGSTVKDSSLTSVGILNGLTVSGDLVVTGDFRLFDVLTIDNSNNRVGILNDKPQYTLDVSGNANLTTGYVYNISGATVLTATKLGSSVTDSSLTSVSTLVSGLNIASGQTYKINGTDILSSTKLASSVKDSSLTSVGILNGLTVSGDLVVTGDFRLFDVLTIDNSNNRVGILNDKPQYTLDVSGNANLTTGYAYNISGANVLTATKLGSKVVDSSLTSVGTLTSLTVSGAVNVNNNALTVTSASGYVGIGTATPSKPLDVYGTNSSMVIKSKSESESSTLFFSTPFTSSAPAKAAIIAQGVTSWSRSKLLFCLGDLSDNTTELSGNDAKLAIQFNGAVGIGTSNPMHKLDISGGDVNLSTANSYRINGNNVVSLTKLGSSIIDSSLTSLGTLSSLTVSGDINIDTNTLKVDSANNRIGILNAAPAYTLDVSGNANLTTGYAYNISGASVLSATNLVPVLSIVA
jgi:hypothetical protein